METYDEIYGRMKNAYEHETGDSFNEVSDIAIRLKVLAGEIFKLQTNLEWWKRLMFAVSASVVFFVFSLTAVLDVIFRLPFFTVILQVAL